MKILLLEDDPKTAFQIAEGLSGFEVIVEGKSESFLKQISDVKPDILLIDFDLREKDGLMVYREARHINPFNKTIMFSSSNSIPLAVIAAKLGVLDFLRKPLASDALREAIEKAIQLDEAAAFDLSKISDSEWLTGCGEKLRKLFEEVRRFSRSNKDFAVLSEKGVNRKAVVELVHSLSSACAKRIVEIKLSPSLSEAHFFLTLKELISASDAEEKQNKRDLPGTIFVEGIDSVPESFRASILQFIREKKSLARVVLGSHDKRAADPLENIDIPPLRERKEDIPVIVLSYLRKHAPEVKYIAPNMLEFLMYYDFPGNYTELEDIIKIAASAFPNAEVLNYKSLLVDIKSGGNVLRNKLFSKEKYGLKEVRAEFEKILFELVLAKVNNDIASAARFLDVPKTVLSSRLTTLELL